MKNNKHNKNKKNTSNNSIVHKFNFDNKFFVKATIIYDDQFEEMINSLMSSELVYGDNNYY